MKTTPEQAAPSAVRDRDFDATVENAMLRYFIAATGQGERFKSFLKDPLSVGTCAENKASEIRQLVFTTTNRSAL